MPMPIRRFPSTEDLTAATVTVATQTERMHVTFERVPDTGVPIEGETSNDAVRPSTERSDVDFDPLNLPRIGTNPGLPRIYIGHGPADARRANNPPKSRAGQYGSRREAHNSASHVHFAASGLTRIRHEVPFFDVPVVDATINDGSLDTPTNAPVSLSAMVESDNGDEDSEDRVMLLYAPPGPVTEQHRFN